MSYRRRRRRARRARHRQPRWAIELLPKIGPETERMMAWADRMRRELVSSLALPASLLSEPRS